MYHKIVVLLLVFGVVLPSVTKAQSSDCGVLSKQFDAAGAGNLVNAFPTQYCSVPNVLDTILKIAFTAAGIAALLFIIYGGYQIMFSAGNAEKASAGRKTLTYAIIGLVIIILAATIVNLVIKVSTKGAQGLF